MKILQVIPTLNPAAGGPVEGLIQQGIEMVRNGHCVHTVCLDAPGAELDDRLRSSAVYMLGPSYLRYAFTWRLEPWLREHGHHYDVIIVHGMWTYHAYCVAKVARALGLRYVVFLHGMLDPWFAREFPLKHLKKWMYWPWAEYRVLRDADLVLFTTAEELALARESFWLYKVRERLVGYGIRAPSIDPMQARDSFLNSFPQFRDTRNLLYLSRIHEKKGCDLLINAFAKIADTDPRLHLIMAGPGDANLLKKLKLLVERLGLVDRVSFPGMLKNAMKWGAFEVAEAFVLPSHQENFGIVVAEALACGVPVLTTYQVNIWREIRNAGAGIVHSDTQQGADQMLEDWLARSDLEKDGMRAKAKECFAEHFEVQNVTQNLLDALEHAARSEAGRPHTFVGSLWNREPRRT